MSAEKILGELKKGSFKPVYWLEGEETYYIDQIIHYAEHHILNESEAGFNLTVFYGRDADWTQVVNACRRYPMFADKQVVLLKEAQHMKDIDKLESYFENPLPSTILVIGYKEKKLDGRSKLVKLLKQKAEFLQTKKLYENQLPEWTQKMIAEQGLSINNKALMLLVEHVGNDLSRLANEVEKLAVNLGARKSITEEDIEKYIGISKEYNVFELQEAIALKNFPKALRIIQYFESNPKAGPIQQLLPTLYGYFSKIYMLFGNDVNEKNAHTLFYNNPYATKAALQCKDLYGYNGVEKCLLLLHHYNLKSIGINDAGTEDGDLLKEMIVKMMY